MEEAILGLPDQLCYKPEVINKDRLTDSYRSITVVGMGGSHLCAGVLKTVDPLLPIKVHNDYGLPEGSNAENGEAVFVFVSYSGGTEEVLDSLEEAYSKGLNMAVITTGGILGDRAKELDLPRVIMPNTGIQPRNAIGYSTVSLATLLGHRSSLERFEELSRTIDPEADREKGVEVAETLLNSIPLIYTSRANTAIAYNWKIKFNETTKIPSFYNVFPEINHNEMEGFGVIDSTKEISSPIATYFLMDSDDSPRVKKRMEVTHSIYRERGIRSHKLDLEGEDRAERFFRGILTADWASLELSRKHYNTDADNVPVVEKFKKIIG